MNRLITPPDFFMEYENFPYTGKVNSMHVGPLSHLTMGRLGMDEVSAYGTMLV